MNHEERILLVDDEAAVTSALKRQFRKDFVMETASSGAEGLEKIAESGPFAVVVSDFNMPQMNGITFLEKVRKVAPETVRLMLTGQAEQNVAVAAVNRGNVFRFLNKPCESELFRSVVESGIAHYRLHRAEKDLLEQTVQGSIAVLVELLELSNPTAFGRATRVRQLVSGVVEALGLPPSWEYDSAALLSQVGCAAVPDLVFAQLSRGEELSDKWREIYEQHPKTAYGMLSKIPRLSRVAEIVSLQGLNQTRDAGVALEVWVGSRILACCLALDERITSGTDPQSAMDELRQEKGRRFGKILDALQGCLPKQEVATQVRVSLSELSVGMTLLEDVCKAENGMPLATKGHVLTESSIQRLVNHDRAGIVRIESIAVQLPDIATDGDQQAA